MISLMSNRKISCLTCGVVQRNVYVESILIYHICCEYEMSLRTEIDGSLSIKPKQEKFHGQRKTFYHEKRYYEVGNLSNFAKFLPASYYAKLKLC